jgi:protein-tyrosine phosphatase
MNQFMNEIANFSKTKLKKASTDTETNIENSTLLLKQVNPDYTIDKIIDGLYLSGDDVATNRQILISNKITHILNVTTNVPNKFESEIIYKRLHLYDLPTQIIDFNASFEFIDNALNNSDEKNNILVHCNQGKSRSVAIVIAYLLQKSIFKTFSHALDYVKEKRPRALPNHGFIQQLNELEEKIFNNT